MSMFAELAEAQALVERDRRGVVVAHLKGKCGPAMTARVSLAGLHQRAADAAAGESGVDRKRIDAQSAR